MNTTKELLRQRMQDLEAQIQTERNTVEPLVQEKETWIAKAEEARAKAQMLAREIDSKVGARIVDLKHELATVAKALGASRLT